LGDIKALQSLLHDAQVSVDAADKAGWTALHKAAYRGHAAAVQLLLDAHASVNAAAANGCTALHGAARKGHTAVVQLLMGAHAGIDAADGSGSTLFCLAAAQGHVRVVQLLLAARQLSPEAMLSAAKAAAAAGYAELAVMVLRALMSRYRPAAEAPRARQYVQTAEVLLQWEAAAAAGMHAQQPAQCPLLHQFLANITKATQQSGATAAADTTASAASAALQAAALSSMNNGAAGSAAVLAAASAAVVAAISKGDQPNHCMAALLQDTASPAPPPPPALAAAVAVAPTLAGLALQRAATAGDAALVQLLLHDAQLPVDAADENGRTALHVAAHQGTTAVVQLLLDAGAHVDVADCDGRALYRAARRGHTAVVHLLLDAHADVNGRHYPTTPLHGAATRGYTQIVQLLLAAPQLATDHMIFAGRDAAAARHAELAIMLVKALNTRDNASAAAAAFTAWPRSLGVDVLRQWQTADEKAKELEGRWPALQQLLMGVLTTHRQLQAAAADITASALNAAQQAATALGVAATKSAVVAASRAAAVAAVSGVAAFGEESVIRSGSSHSS
jgi:ankyrin repeat protein